ncbi:MAG: tetratricopeptide repeat protein, partial [Leptolyngbyaceae bacterium]|nr:tetratricopeptide repeat protein [Leptolyngbyaceae bacterium]
AYHQTVDELATKQYESLGESLDLIGHISEVNMVYLMRQTSTGTLNKKPDPSPRGKPPKPPEPPPPPPSVVERAMSRAKQFEINEEFTKAIQELRDAIQLNPKDARVDECYSRLGNIYLKTKQGTMAKIHFKKALDLNPNNEVAKAGMKRFEATEGKGKSPDKPGKGNNSSSKPGKGGFLSNLFGKKN